MSTPFIGEIRMFGGNFAPAGWAFCNGALIPISENDALFNLIGTTYGGDGQNTFALPNLQSRVPVHAGTGPGGQSFILGESGGQETVTLTVNQIPAHNHVPGGFTGTGGQSSPANGVWASSGAKTLYSDTAPGSAMSADAVKSGGGSQPHDNMIPFLVINFILSLFGVFPTAN